MRRTSASKEKPLSNYCLYYILERELFYKESGIKTEKKTISDLDLHFFGDIARSFPLRPSRYDSLELSSTWFIRKAHCRRDRSKKEGIALADLSIKIAASWKTCAREVKNYVNDIAHILREHYASVAMCQEIRPTSTKPASFEHIDGDDPNNSSSFGGDSHKPAAIGIYNSVLSQSVSVSRTLFPGVPDELLQEVQTQTICNSVPDGLLQEVQTQTKPFVPSLLQGQMLTLAFNPSPNTLEQTQTKPFVPSLLQGQMLTPAFNPSPNTIEDGAYDYVKACIAFESVKTEARIDQMACESILAQLRNAASSQFAFGNTFKFEASKPQEPIIENMFHQPGASKPQEEPIIENRFYKQVSQEPIIENISYQTEKKDSRIPDGYADAKRFAKECTNRHCWELYGKEDECSKNRDYATHTAFEKEGYDEVDMSNEEIRELWRKA